MPASPAESTSRAWVRAAAAVWIGIAAFLAVRLSGLAQDDFFITYRYAWNLAAGNGFVFNAGERVFGLTDPGIGLLLAALHFVTRLPIPALGSAVTGAALAGIALLVLLEGRDRCRTTEAVVGGTLVVSSSYLWLNQGAGVFLAVLLLLLAARLADRSLWISGLLAGAAVWMRPDAVVGVGLLGLLLWIERRRLPWAYAFAGTAVIAAGALAAWAYFGSVVPNTLAAKNAMAAVIPAGSESWAGGRFWARSFPILPRHWGAQWRWIAALGLLGHGVLLAKGGRMIRLLALFSLALAVAYPLLDVPFFTWYIVPSAIAVLYGLAFLAGAAGRMSGRRTAAVAVGLLLLLPVFVSLVPASWRWCRNHNWQRHLRTYREAALWIRDHSAPTDEIAYVEIGVLAFYSERTVVDLMGLVTPEAIPYVEVGDLVGAFLARPARFVVFHSRGRMLPLLNRRWFQSAYEQVARFEEGEDRELTVYRRLPGSRIRPPRKPKK